MRDILFRGKRIDNGQWVYGSPIFQDNYVLIRFWNSEEFEYEEYLVAPESVGQYTGINDRSGKKVFEGDIVNIEYDETTVENCVISYVGAWFCGSTYYDDWELDEYVDLEVIGNVFENADLLEG